MTIAFIVANDRDTVSLFTSPQTAGESGSVICSIQMSAQHPIIANSARAMLTLYQNGKKESSSSSSNFSKPLVLTKPLDTVKLSNAGNWTCSYYLSSSNLFIQSSNAKTNSTKVIVKSKCIRTAIVVYLLNFTVPNTIKPHITPSMEFYETGTNVTLFCSVTYPQYDFIDLSTTVKLLWLTSPYNNSSFLNNFTKHTLKYTLRNLKLSHAKRNYSCSSVINVSTPHPYIIASEPTSTSSTVGVISK